MNAADQDIAGGGARPAATPPAGSDSDPLDLDAAPFGTFAMSSAISAVRNAVISDAPPFFLKRWLYKSFAHYTRRKGLIVDLHFMGMKRRLFVDEFAHDKWIFRKGRHAEPDELATIQEFADQPVQFVDIGANNGFFSVLCDKVAAPGARILAIEPHPRTFRKLTLHLRMNEVDAIVAENVAVGAEKGEMPLSINIDDDGSNTLSPRNAPSAENSVQVPVEPLLDLVRRHGFERIDLLKIDVEGYEDRVLEPFFATAPPALWPDRVMMEIAYRAKRWETDCLARMTGRGYAIDKQTRDNAWLSLDRAKAALN